jgi:peptidoglycan/xylan/chitin deacetylase (PgdA/CDA1 family)
MDELFWTADRGMERERILGMLKASAKRVLRMSGPVLVRRSPGRAVVLCYHSIHPSNSFRSATPTLFDEHLAWITQNCNVVPFGGILPAAERPSRRPTVSITFDDGHEDNHRFALPSLKHHGLSATFFLAIGLMEKNPDVVDRFKRLRRSDYDAIRPMEWGQVRELIDEGMDIGAHSYSHRNFVRLERSELRYELVAAKQVIEDRLSRQVTSFAYPFGKPRIHFTDEAAEMVRGAGYRLAAVTVKRGVRISDPPLRVPRMFVTHDSVEELREKVLGYWDAVGILQEHSPLWLSRLVSPMDFAY